MTEQEILNKFKESGFNVIHEHPAWKSFVTQMSNKQYGIEPLLQAWHFFRIGWDAEDEQ